MVNKSLPDTMKAAQGKDYGEIEQVLTVEQGVKTPTLDDLPPKTRNQFMIIKTHAVALAPGDCRVLSGKTRELQGPPSFPYIPGGDCSGIVAQLPSDDSPFEIGDRVAARFVEGPRDALGEYALVHQAVCEKIPDDISSDDAAALIGATPSILLADRIRPGERVLILGAGGGEGSHLCQLIKERASLLVGASQSPDRLLKPPLTYDKAIDYTQENPFSVREFQQEPFDVIVDLASGGWPMLLQSVQQKEPMIIKPASQGGRFLTCTMDTASYEVHGVWTAVKLFLFTTLWRAFVTRTFRRFTLPAFSFTLNLPRDRAVATRAMELAKTGALKAVLDPKGPFPFTTEGVRAAFRVQENRHPHGKVVVRVANP